jgi:hypothetical protein
VRPRVCADQSCPEQSVVVCGLRNGEESRSVDRTSRCRKPSGQDVQCGNKEELSLASVTSALMSACEATRVGVGGILCILKQPLPVHPQAACVFPPVIRMCVDCVCTRMYPKVSGLATWSENCKLYRSLPLGAVVSLFCESV